MAIEQRNQADALAFQAERTINELGDKVEASEKSTIEANIEKVKSALEGSDVAAIKSSGLIGDKYVSLSPGGSGMPVMQGITSWCTVCSVSKQVDGPIYKKNVLLFIVFFNSFLSKVLANIKE